ncbi:hypothetical protein [Mycolicibacillus koreensis]|nr:hypothetical protein [Mycolicibacillus koreensis]
MTTALPCVIPLPPRDIVGRYDFDIWWALSSQEAEKLIAGLSG